MIDSREKSGRNRIIRCITKGLGIAKRNKEMSTKQIDNFITNLEINGEKMYAKRENGQTRLYSSDKKLWGIVKDGFIFKLEFDEKVDKNTKIPMPNSALRRQINGNIYILRSVGPISEHGKVLSPRAEEIGKAKF